MVDQRDESGEADPLLVRQIAAVKDGAASPAAAVGARALTTQGNAG